MAARPTSRARLAVVAILAATAALGAQDKASSTPTSADVVLTVRLAADADRRGPAGWTELRDGELRDLAPPHVAVTLSADGDPVGAWHLGADDDLAPHDDDYLTAELTIDGVSVARGSLEYSGLARFEVDVSGIDRWPATLRRLAGVYGPDAIREFVGIDVSAVLARLGPDPAAAPGTVGGDALVAAACEGVTLAARRTSADRLVVTAAGPGGLTLPLWMAWRRAAAAPTFAAIPEHEAERTIWLATTAFGDARHEAVRQFARLRGAASTRMLERLALAPSPLGESASLALAYAGRSDSLAALAAAARHGANRAEIARLAAERVAPDLLTQELTQPPPPPVPGTTDTPSWPRWRTALVAGLGTFAASLVVALLTLAPRRIDALHRGRTPAGSGD